MNNESKEQFEKILKDMEKNNNNFLDDGIWALMLLALMFSQPPKQEPPVTNIFIGGEE